MFRERERPNMSCFYKTNIMAVFKCIYWSLDMILLRNIMVGISCCVCVFIFILSESVGCPLHGHAFGKSRRAYYSFFLPSYWAWILRGSSERSSEKEGPDESSSSFSFGGWPIVLFASCQGPFLPCWMLGTFWKVRWLPMLQFFEWLHTFFLKI